MRLAASGTSPSIPRKHPEPQIPHQPPHSAARLLLLPCAQRCLTVCLFCTRHELVLGVPSSYEDDFGLYDYVLFELRFDVCLLFCME